ncbi:MAG: hypothetical protein Q7S59_05860 [Sulfurimonas sp.]|nr:hypothetical protein [Sulfurimonas sp.]
MTTTEFKNVMRDGFSVLDTEKGNELRCFTCGEVIKLVGSTMVCVKGHRFTTIVYLTSYSNMRNAMAREFIDEGYSFK